MKRLTSLLLATLLFATLLAGCASTNDPATTDPTTAPTTSSGGSEATTAAPTEGPSGEKRTDLVVPAPSALASIDPYFYTASSDNAMQNMVYEALFISRFTFEGENYYQPLLAKDYTVNDDATEFTVTLRDDVTFSNGEKFTSDDVVFSVERAKTSPIINTYAGIIDTVEAIDEYTVKLTLVSPSSSFLLNLCSIAMMNREFTDAIGEKITEEACGTGPYVLSEAVEAQRYVFTARDDYYLGKSGIEKVTFRVIPDPTTQLTAFEAGEIDLVNVGAADWEDIVASGNYNTYPVKTSSLAFLMYNHEREPFTDVRVRQAVNYAIDRDAINDFVTGGTSTVAYAILAPGIVSDAVEPDNPYLHSIDKAKELLAEAGYPDGLTLDEPIKTLAGTSNEQAVAIQQQLAMVGIKVDIELCEANTYMSDAVTGNYLIGTLGIGMPNAFNLWGTFMVTAGIDSLNLGRYSNPEVDQLFDDIAKETDAAARAALAKKATNIMNDEAAYAPLYHVTGLYALNKNLTPAFPINYCRYYEYSWN